MRQPSPLRDRAFRLQFLARAASAAGSSLAPIALSFGVLDRGGTSADLALVLGAYSVCFVAFVLVGGVWADRLPRQRVMMITDLAQAATQATSGVLLLAGHSPMWTLMALSAVNGTASAFFQPASTGLTASVVRAEHLQHATALLSLTNSVASIAGPVLGSVIVATAGAGWALCVNALTFVGSAAFLSRLNISAETARVQRARFLAELAEGFREVRQRCWVWASLLSFGAYHLAFGSFLVLGPVMLAHRTQGALGWGAVIGCLGLGSLVGDLLALRLRPCRLLFGGRVLELGALPMLILLAWSAPVPLLAAGAVLGGVAVTLPDALWYTALQQHIPPAKLSRVSSFDWMGSLVLRPVGFAAAASVAAVWGRRGTLMACAVLLGLAIGASLLVREVRELRRTDGPPVERTDGPAEASVAAAA